MAVQDAAKVVNFRGGEAAPFLIRLMVVLPIALLIGYDFTRRKLYEKKHVQNKDELPAELVLIASTTPEADSYIHVVKVLAEAIQADGTTAAGIPAVEDAWGITLDANGNITPGP